MSTHALKCPSKFERIRLCPGSVREEAKYPDQPGAAAADGTHSHTLLELCVENDVRDANEYLKMTLTDHEGQFTVDHDRVRRVNVALDYIWSRSEKAGVKPYSEVRLSSVGAFGRDDMGGTCDVHYYSPQHRFLEVIDYKDGMGPVEPDCDQMEIYALMLISHYGVDNLTTVRLTIIQPKLEYRGEKGVVHVELDARELWAKRQVYIDAAALSDSSDAPLSPGEKQCKYCKHKGACAALSNSMLTNSGIKFENLDIAQQAADKEPTELSNDQLCELVESAPLLR